MTINTFYGGHFIFDRFITVTGTASFAQFASGTARMMRIRADHRNIGTFFIDNYMQAQGVYPIDAGDELDWSPGPYDLSMLGSLNPSGSSDYLYIWAKV